MTNFDKEKARAQADAWFPLSPNNIKYYHNDVKQDYFVRGARWQASQPIVVTDEMVERAIAVDVQHGADFNRRFTLKNNVISKTCLCGATITSHKDDVEDAVLRHVARAVLEAALGVSDD